MREWNATGNQPRVHFTGFDMQFKDAAVDSVKAFAADVDVTTGDFVRNAYACLPSQSGVAAIAIYAARPAAVRDACRGQLQSVDSLFARNLPAWRNSLGSDRTTLTQRLARIVSQWEADVDPNSRLRDRFMAENLAWWHERLPHSGTAAWAHNGHVMKAPQMMGSYLQATFGGDYRNIATTFSRGQFNAYSQNASGAIGPLGPQTMSFAQPGSIESVFDGTGLNRAILDTRRIPSGGSASAALAQSVTMRTIGALYNPTADVAQYNGRIFLPLNYDVIVWFRIGTPTQLSSGTLERAPSERRP
jgi:erythromycin esterase-like protein